MTPLTQKLTSFDLDLKNMKEHEFLKIIFLEIVDFMDKNAPKELPEHMENILMVIQSRLMDQGQKQIKLRINND